MKYYVDTSIWLNIFKKEGDSSKGIPYWKLAKDFITKVILSEEDSIVYSGFVLKEVQYGLNNDKLFDSKRRFLKSEPKFNFVKALNEDYRFARRLESEFNFEISFFDCQHIAISKRLGCVLVTRDNKLIENAAKYIKVSKPENLFT